MCSENYTPYNIRNPSKTQWPESVYQHLHHVHTIYAFIIYNLQLYILDSMINTISLNVVCLLYSVLIKCVL
jgi:hypothetical protein